MVTTEQRNQARNFLKKAEEYLAAAEDSVVAGRSTPAAGDAIAGISAKDAIVSALTGSTGKGKDHSTAAKELSQALGKRPDASSAAKALRELLSAKAEVEYGVTLVTEARALALVRRARTLVELAGNVVRLGR